MWIITRGENLTTSDDYSGQSLTNPTIPKEFLNIKKKSVNIGKHVIVGSGSVILPDVSIGEGSCIGALSLVNKSLESWNMYFGSPVKNRQTKKRSSKNGTKTVKTLRLA